MSFWVFSLNPSRYLVSKFPKTTFEPLYISAVGKKGVRTPWETSPKKFTLMGERLERVSAWAKEKGFDLLSFLPLSICLSLSNSRFLFLILSFQTIFSRILEDRAQSPTIQVSDLRCVLENPLFDAAIVRLFSLSPFRPFFPYSVHEIAYDLVDPQERESQRHPRRIRSIFAQKSLRVVRMREERTNDSPF